MIAHVFKKKFQNKFNEDIELFKLLDSNKKIFSSYIIYQLLNFSREFKMESSKEYWKIDCIYYTKDKLFEKFANGVWLKRINVLIENENKISEAHLEINKLLHWNSDLKVIITYYNKESGLEKYLTFWCSIISEMQKLKAHKTENL